MLLDMGLPQGINTMQNLCGHGNTQLDLWPVCAMESPIVFPYWMTHICLFQMVLDTTS